MNAKSKKNQSDNNQVATRGAYFSERLHSGPIPDPESLAKYDLVKPGFAERIISMAESEASSRRSNEKRVFAHSIIMSYLGIFFALLSVIIMASLVYYAISKGFDSTAAIIAVGSIAAVAGVFVFFRRSKRDANDR